MVIECDNDPLDAPYTGLHGGPKRPYACLDLPYNYRRWEFMLFPGEDAEAMLRPEKVRELLTVHVPDPTALNIIRAHVYTHHSRVADRFVDGRICLVGDAAHLMPPWAGQGMNTGIRDPRHQTVHARDRDRARAGCAAPFLEKSSATFSVPAVTEQ